MKVKSDYQKLVEKCSELKLENRILLKAKKIS